jgi:hypothetical protein
LQNWIYPWWRRLKELNRGPWQMASPETANNLKFPPGGLNSRLPPFRCYFDTEAIRPSSWDQLGCNIFNCKFGLASHMSDGSAGSQNHDNRVRIILTVFFKRNISGGPDWSLHNLHEEVTLHLICSFFKKNIGIWI